MTFTLSTESNLELAKHPKLKKNKINKEIDDYLMSNLIPIPYIIIRTGTIWTPRQGVIKCRVMSLMIKLSTVAE